MDLNPDLPTGDEKAEKVQGMFDRIAPRYDFVNRIMTFRLKWDTLVRESRIAIALAGYGVDPAKECFLLPRCR